MRVLISGAGIAGPTLAYFLQKIGARVTVVEKAKAILPHGQNIDLKGGAVTVVRKMGLLDEVKRNNTTEKGTRFIDSNGRPFAPFPVREGAGASFTSEYEILRGDLAKILYEATRDKPNVEYLLDTTVSHVDSNDDKSVRVTLSNGQTHEYDLLVAADGQWSRLRKQVFPAESVTIVDKGMHVAYWTIPRSPQDEEWWSIYFELRSRTISIRPDPHGTMRAMMSHMPSTAEQHRAWTDAARGDRATQHDVVRRVFADAGWEAPRMLDAMAEAPDFYLQTIQQVKMETWSRGRVICLGDAAFTPSPLTGGGTSLAIMGGYLLAGELATLQAAEHPAKAFAVYEARFRPFVEQIQQVPFFVPAIAHPGSAWKRWLVQALISTLARIAATQWAQRRSAGGEAQDDGFKLPTYASLD